MMFTDSCVYTHRDWGVAASTGSRERCVITSEGRGLIRWFYEKNRHEEK
jgi:hypothetical protein